MPEPRAARVLYVCTGNICRSPMAEGLTRTLAGVRGLAVEAASAGTHGLEEQPAEPRAVAVCAELGVDIRDHRARVLDADHLAWADHVLVMEITHADFILGRWPATHGKVRLLAAWGGLPGIADPYGSWFKGPYRTCRDEVRRCIDRLLDANDLGAPRLD